MSNSDICGYRPGNGGTCGLVPGHDGDHYPVHVIDGTDADSD